VPALKSGVNTTVPRETFFGLDTLSVSAIAAVGSTTPVGKILYRYQTQIAGSPDLAGANMSKDRLIIFDTTLRDGEQSPGASMTKDEKVRIARALEKMRVDVIEAGFPIASTGDFEGVRAVARVVKDSTVCGLARAMEADIARAGEALKDANSGRIHTFIATSPVHMERKLRMTPDKVVEQAVWAVRRARDFTDDVEFSAEDAGRSELDFLCRIFEAVIDAGATTINVPDTVGYNVPRQFGHTMQQLIERIPNSDKAVFSVHCHNDLGLAVANSLSAVMNGARQVECTINGLGERAGNASLEEVVMAVRTRQDVFDCDTNLDTTQIVPCSKLVSSITGFPVQPNKAIVGANAFAHESGIHQDGVLKHRETYEIMRAEDVGWTQNRMVLGKHSGRNAFRNRLEELGIEFASEEELNAAFARFKDLADKKHEIFDEDLQALVTEKGIDAENERVRLVFLRVVSETGEIPNANVTLCIDGEERAGTAEGGGPVDAAYKAIEALVNTGSDLKLYSVNNITSGTDSQGEVTVRLEKGGRLVNGQGADTDIVIASAKAYINGVNKLMEPVQRAHPQGDV
jgi:2-isopropylmalate synthase